MDAIGSAWVFWMLAFLLVTVALVFILPPFLRRDAPADRNSRSDINIAVYRDQLREMEADLAGGLLSEDQFQAAKRELEVRLADDALAQGAQPASASAGNRGLGYALATLLPVAAFGLYFLLGNPDALRPTPPAAPGAPMGMHDIGKMIRQAEAKVKANPKDAESWAMLARSYAALNRWPEAWKAYQLAAELKPGDASLLAGQAEALAVLKGGALQGEPMRLVQQALALDPNDAKALELAAAGAFQQREFSRAAEILEKLYRQVPPGDPFSRQVQAAMMQARQLAQGSAPAPSRPVSAEKGVTIRGSIELSDAVRARVDPRDTIFLFARPTGGGPPVAAVRGPAASFPMDFELSDRWAMNPENPLSGHKRVTLVARISKTGSAMAQSGDLEGSVTDVAVGAQGVKLVIDRAIP